jgi:hypothetical protein
MPGKSKKRGCSDQDLIAEGGRQTTKFTGAVKMFGQNVLEIHKAAG